MKNRIVRYGVLFGFCMLSAGAAQGATQKFSVGARRHVEHSVFDQLPFDAGDISYGVAYEYHEDAAYWQIALSFCPHPRGASATNSVDYVYTPQLNLVFRDGIWRGGLGILTSYLKPDEGESEWTSLYYQFLLGLQFPVAGLELDIQAFYTFEKWSLLDAFEVDDIEFGIWLTYTF